MEGERKKKSRKFSRCIKLIGKLFRTKVGINTQQESEREDGKRWNKEDYKTFDEKQQIQFQDLFEFSIFCGKEKN
jgi:hypothetical protein